MAFSLKQLFPRTLFGRSLMILVTPVLLIQIITAYVFFDRHWDKVTDRLAEAVAGEIAIIAVQVETRSDDIELMKQLSGYAVQNLNLLVSYIPDEDMDSLTAGKDMQPSIVVDTLAEYLEIRLRRPFKVFIDFENKWIEVFVSLEQGTLLVSLPQRRLFSSSSYIFLLWMIFSSVILLGIATMFMRNQIRPIRRLAIVAERFGKGQDAPKNFRAEGAREVRRATLAFLDMHRRIKRQMDQRTLMLAGVSHDLRTPLTRMKLQTEMLTPSPDVDDLKADIDDMERMINAYLEFVRGQGDEQPERVDLSGMINALVKRVEKTKVDIRGAVDEGVSLIARPIALERAVNNIIANARKYADTIWVSLKQDDDYVYLVIEDNGQGIEPENYEQVFKPFYRIEASRNQNTVGVGLGLPIAQDIVSAHGGTIKLDKSEHGGLFVQIRLPL